MSEESDDDDGGIGPGQWEETRDICPCVCDSPVSVIEVATVLATPAGPDPDAFDGAYYGLDATYVGGSTKSTEENPSSIAYLRFRYFNSDQRPRKLRLRMLTITTNELGNTSYSLGDEFALIDAGGTGQLINASGLTLTCPDPGAENVVNFFVAAVGKSYPIIDRVTQFAQLHKKGFAPYLYSGPPSKFFFLEVVEPGSGFPGGGTLPAQTYSGAQVYSEGGSPSDPAGKYVNSLSADLKTIGCASAPICDGTRSARIANSFGRVTESETTRVMTQPLAGQTKVLSLRLSSEYTTDILEMAIQESLDRQEETGNSSPGDGPVALHRLTADEAFLARRKTHVVIHAPIIAAYVDEGSSFTAQVTWTREVTNFSTSQITDTAEQHEFGFVAASNGFSPGGRPAVESDSDFEFDENALSNSLVTILDSAITPSEFYVYPFTLEIYVQNT